VALQRRWGDECSTLLVVLMASVKVQLAEVCRGVVEFFLTTNEAYKHPISSLQQTFPQTTTGWKFPATSHSLASRNL
jgi:hypothetical protein